MLMKSVRGGHESQELFGRFRRPSFLALAWGLVAGAFLGGGASSAAGVRCQEVCPEPLFEAADGGPIYETDAIVKMVSGTFDWREELEIGYSFFRNEAYACGYKGVHNFLVVEPKWGPKRKNLWVLMVPGGTGYFDRQETDPEKIYYSGAMPSKTNGKGENTELAPLLTYLDQHLGVSGGIFLERFLSGEYRVVLPSSCDHDTYSGMGAFTDPAYLYPLNPYRPEDRVDGLLATLAAVQYSATEQPTDLVFLHGTSAGAFGAYAAAYVFAQRGVLLNGLILDSGLNSSTFDDYFFDFPPEDGPCLSGQLANPEIDICQLREKIGPFYCDPELFVEQTVASLPGGVGSFDIPLFDLASANDEDCCGPTEPWLEEAILVGGNCQYLHDGLARALATKGDPLQRSVVYPGGDHVLTVRSGPWQEDLKAWLQDVLAASPNAPWAHDR